MARRALTGVLALTALLGLGALAGPAVAAPTADSGEGRATASGFNPHRLAVSGRSGYVGDGYQFVAGSPLVIHEAGGIAGFPGLYSTGSGTAYRTWLSFTRSGDFPNEPVEHGMFYSTWGGIRFKPAESVDVRNAVQIAGGETIAVAQRAFAYRNGTRAAVDLWHGESWTPARGELVLRTPLQPGSGVTFSQGIERNGTVVVAPYYGRFAGDPVGRRTTRVELAASADGVHWTTRGTIARPGRFPNGDHLVYNEAAVLRLPGGALYAVLRRERFTPGGHRVGVLPTAYSLSVDGGYRWIAPRTLFINGRRFASGAQPSVLRMPNGVYVLAVGRPDNYLAFARRTNRDGSPRWSGRLLLYRNYPTAPYRGKILRSHGSSGYVAITAVSRNRLLAVADNCAPGWGCARGLTGWVVDNRDTLVARYIDIVPR
jgi:hypothetical protein